MINAMDTFYVMLRNRLAALNPARTMVLRGVTRPGVLVEENELVNAAAPPDVFRLRWTEAKVDTQLPLPMASMVCEIRYATQGTAANAGMDRGRLLAYMDAELSMALRSTPHNIVKANYMAGVGGGPPLMLATNVFWSDAVYKAVKQTAESLERLATIEVFCFEEVGE